jgi:hypothetical protein
MKDFGELDGFRRAVDGHWVRGCLREFERVWWWMNRLDLRCFGSTIISRVNEIFTNERGSRVLRKMLEDGFWVKLAKIDRGR